jgi:hypothetical protein
MDRKYLYDKQWTVYSTMIGNNGQFIDMMIWMTQSNKIDYILYKQWTHCIQQQWYEECRREGLCATMICLYTGLEQTAKHAPHDKSQDKVCTVTDKSQDKVTDMSRPRKGRYGRDKHSILAHISSREKKSFHCMIKRVQGYRIRNGASIDDNNTQHG